MLAAVTASAPVTPAASAFLKASTSSAWIGSNGLRGRAAAGASSGAGCELGAANKGEEALFLITARDGINKGQILGACGFVTQDKAVPELGYWLGVEHWGKGYATEALHALIDYMFNEFDHVALQAGARVTNPNSRRVLEKCGFQWTGVGLYRIRAINSSAPIDRFRLERGIWSALKAWGKPSGRSRKVM